MLDLKFIRREPTLVSQAARAKGSQIDIAQILQLDEKRRHLLVEVEQLKSHKKKASEKVAQAKKQGQDASALISELKQTSMHIKTLEQQCTQVQQELEELLLWVPNLPAQDVPSGDESANQVIRTWGTLPSFEFAARTHWDLGKALDILDIEAGARLAGSGFVMLKGLGAQLERALINFMLDLHVHEHGYQEIAPPYLGTRAIMQGSAQIPKLTNDMYRIEKDDLFLIPTAEVPLVNLLGNQILDSTSLPLSFTARTPCFRREAGAHGKDTRGLLRVHQFMKVELVKICRPENSFEELEILLSHAETVLQRLQLPYRVVLLATGDLTFASAKTYDLELWAPGVQRWLEVSSCSNCLDFQARRIGLRYKTKGVKGSKPQFVHTLNASGVALPRLIVAILENGQQADGRVRLPEALWPYMHGIQEIKIP